jgi:hypothetical protein
MSTAGMSKIAIDHFAELRASLETDIEVKTRYDGSIPTELGPYLEYTMEGSAQIPLMPDWSHSIAANLTRLAQVAAQADKEKMTIGEADRLGQLQLALPPLRSDFATSQLRELLPFAIVATLLYMQSLIGALLAEIEESDREVRGSLVFFHPGWIGFALGTVWLLAPPILVVIVAYHSSGAAPAVNFVLAFVGVCSVLVTLWRAASGRVSYLR